MYQELITINHPVPTGCAVPTPQSNDSQLIPVEVGTW